jgi:hypothetical protein
MAINCRRSRAGSCAMAPHCRLGSYAMTPRAYHRWGDTLAVQRGSTLERNRADQGHRRTHRPVAAVPGVAHFAPSVAPLAQTKPARTSSSPQRTLSVPVNRRIAGAGPGSRCRSCRGGRARGALRSGLSAFASGSDWALPPASPCGLAAGVDFHKETKKLSASFPSARWSMKRCQ